MAGVSSRVCPPVGVLLDVQQVVGHGLEGELMQQWGHGSAARSMMSSCELVFSGPWVCKGVGRGMKPLTLTLAGASSTSPESPSPRPGWECLPWGVSLARTGVGQLCCPLKPCRWGGQTRGGWPQGVGLGRASQHRLGVRDGVRDGSQGSG